MKSLQLKAWGFLTLALIMNIVVWSYARPMQARWMNVPPAPSYAGSMISSLGDPQFAYRRLSLVLQNLGDTGGRSTALKDYDYATLEDWFYLADKLDPVSDYVPRLAAYYYGSSQNAKDTIYVIRYLEQVGQHHYEEKWRWLAHAVHLARHRYGDMNIALDLAYKLAAIGHENKDIPAWAQQMPAFLLTEELDESDSARRIMCAILADADHLDPAEINHTIAYIKENILKNPAVSNDKICQFY